MKFLGTILTLCLSTVAIAFTVMLSMYAVYLIRELLDEFNFTKKVKSKIKEKKSNT